MKKILNSSQIKQIDTETIINEPILSIDLMERAAQRLFDKIAERFSKENRFDIFAGPGNNGGDAIALYRIMKLAGYQASLYLVNTDSKISPDCQTNIQRLNALGMSYSYITNTHSFPLLSLGSIIVDGIFGNGLNKPVEGFFADIINKINQLPNPKISIDIPSGLFDDFIANESFIAIKATYTVSIQFPKMSFFYPENELFVGEWDIVDINLNPEAIEKANTINYLIEQQDLKNICKPRLRFSHKGTFGHALIIAGSEGKYGAMILSSTACLRSGAGMVTVLCDTPGQTAIHASTPEIMAIKNLDVEKLRRFSTVAIGPGLGTTSEKKILLELLLENYTNPIVVDADALNLLAENPQLLEKLPQNSVITPHIGEFERLTGRSENHRVRLQKAQHFAKKHQIIVVLKGANTAVVSNQGEIFFNQTGNPGMATAGSGDVLTGIIAGILCSGYSPLDASIMGVWVHGKAGDYASIEQSQESLIASDIIRNLGKAFKSVN